MLLHPLWDATCILLLLNLVEATCVLACTMNCGAQPMYNRSVFSPSQGNLVRILGLRTAKRSCRPERKIRTRTSHRVHTTDGVSYHAPSINGSAKPVLINFFMGCAEYILLLYCGSNLNTYLVSKGFEPDPRASIWG